MPNRDDDNDPERKNPNSGREGPISPNLRAYMSQRREKLRREADAILLRSTPEIIASREKHRPKLEANAAKMLHEAYLRTIEPIVMVDHLNVVPFGMDASQALRRRQNPRIDLELVENLRGMSKRELEKAKPDWAIVRGSFFSLAAVFLAARDAFWTEAVLQEGYRLMQEKHGEHAKPVIAYVSKAFAWCLARKLLKPASRFAEALHFTLGGHLPKQDSRLAFVWMRLAECYRLVGRPERAIAAAIEAWIVILARKGRAPDVAPLLFVARVHLSRGRFKEAAEAARLLLKVAEAYGFAETEHAHDARALLSEVT